MNIARVTVPDTDSSVCNLRAITAIFKVVGVTRPGIELKSPAVEADSLTTTLFKWDIYPMSKNTYMSHEIRPKAFMLSVLIPIL